MRHIKKILSVGCAVALLASGSALTTLGGVITVGEGTQTAVEVSDSVGVWGTVIAIENGRIRMNNISGNSASGEMVINIVKGSTRVVEAVNGFPVSLEELKPGDFIYAYLGPAMTMSLPPMVNGQMIICKAPADMKVPEYIRVTGVEAQADGSVRVSGNNGRSYVVPADCQILPYLTRNMVTIQDIAKDRTCLIWSDGNNQAGKVVLFAPESEDTVQDDTAN